MLIESTDKSVVKQFLVYFTLFQQCLNSLPHRLQVQAWGGENQKGEKHTSNTNNKSAHS